MKATMYADGGSRGNPGPAACGFVILDDDGVIIFEKGVYLGFQTNNFAEYTGLIEGMKKALEMGVTDLSVKMDSELVVRQCLGIYKVKNEGLKLLFAEVAALRRQFKSVGFGHVRREFNKDADRMVNECLDAEAGGI